VEQAETALRAKVSAGPVPDIISRATSAFRDAKRAAQAPERAVREQGEKAARAIIGAVKSAVKKDKEALEALGQGAKDLAADVASFVAGPVIILALLWLASQ
jgi:hypothetical protein